MADKSKRNTDHHHGHKHESDHHHHGGHDHKHSHHEDDSKHGAIGSESDYEDAAEDLSDATLLKQGALELGASEDDIKLVENIKDDESEQEFDDQKDDPKLADEVKDYMKNLGFEQKSIKADTKKSEAKKEKKDTTKKVEKSKKDHKQKDHDKKHNHDKKEDETDKKQNEHDSDSANHSKDEEEDLEGPQEPRKFNAADFQSVTSTNLVVEPRNDWYNIDLHLTSTTADRSFKQYEVDELYERARSIVNKDNDDYYTEFNKSSSQRKFMSQILSNGTLSDKISALTLLIQESPLHNMKALDTLLAMCSKKSRSAATQCVEAVTDLFVNGVIPSNRKLKFFKNQPLTRHLTDLQLAVFYFEDYLKNWYFQFIEMLEKLSHDSISFVRSKVIASIFELLIAKPEQEVNLLRLGVNKLGDIDSKISSKASYCVLMLEQKHPAMREIVVNAVIDIMFRENIEDHAIYYSVITLNQTILTAELPKLSEKLVNAYLSLFEKLLVKTDADNVGKLKEGKYNKQGRHKRNFKRGKHGGKSVKVEKKSKQEVIEEQTSKILSAILTGLNRAFPFSNLKSDVFTSHLKTLYRITHSCNFNTSVQALILLQKIVAESTDEAEVDRYYRTLYESLLDDRLLTSSKQAIYLNLLFKSLKHDSNKPRVLAFAKRICQICLDWLNIGTISGMLYLLIQLSKSVSEIKGLLLNKQPADSKYDPRKRDPKFANADQSALWEIDFFLRHYHPTVQLYADSMLESKKIAKPDLGLFTLGHFLNRFVYKKPKQKSASRGQSIMQPIGGAQTGDMLVKVSNEDNAEEVPVNTTEWIKRKAENVRPEDRFFYQYFITKQERDERSAFDKNVNKEAKEPFDEEGEELGEEEVWNALVASNPTVEGDDLYDDEISDLSASDFDSDDDEDENDEEAESLMKALESSSEDEDDDEEIPDEDSEVEEETEDEQKRPAEEGESKRKKRKLSSMPLYASAEDYADLINQGDEDDDDDE